MKRQVEKETEKFLFDDILTEKDDFLMEWPCQDATTSGKESKEVDDDEQLSVNEAGDFVCGNEPLSVTGFEAFPSSLSILLA